MTTVVPGLIKIGKTGSDSFENRMYTLERNGYFNVVGLKRRFAIEVENYDEKEILLDEIFSKSKVPNSELFALDAELVVQLLSSFEGKQIYPEEKSKNEVFIEAAEESLDKINRQKIPDGEYHLSSNVKNVGKITATMIVKDGTFIVKKGCTCVAPKGEKLPEVLKNAPIKNGVLQADLNTTSPSTAGNVVLGRPVNGWTTWKDKNGNYIDIYRK